MKLVMEGDRSQAQPAAAHRGRLGGACALWAAGLTGALTLHLAPTQAAPLVTGSQASVDDAPFRANELTLGAATAPVTVVEYLSVTCAHCAAFERDTWPQVRDTLVATGRVRFVIREMPTAPVAVSAAGFLMARCRGEAEYWPTVERLLREQARILKPQSVEEALRAEAVIAGLGEDETRLCLSDPVAIDEVNARRQAGLALGVDSTPFFLMNGSPLRPGVRLGGDPYFGGELTYRQFAAAVARAARASNGGVGEPLLDPAPPRPSRKSHQPLPRADGYS